MDCVSNSVTGTATAASAAMACSQMRRRRSSAITIGSPVVTRERTDHQAAAAGHQEQQRVLRRVLHGGKLRVAAEAVSQRHAAALAPWAERLEELGHRIAIPPLPQDR